MSTSARSDGVRAPRENIIIQGAAAERAATRWTLGDGGCWISTYTVASHGYAQIGWNENGLSLIHI